MTFKSDADYQEARSLLPQVKDPSVKKRLATKIAIYESEQGIEGGDTSVSGIRPTDHAPVPDAPLPAAPKPGQQGYWAPQRELGALDFVPQDTGGKLEIWHEVPYEAFRKRVLGPQTQGAIAAANKAKLELQMFGPQALSPEDFAQRVQVMAQGTKAEQLAGAEPIDSDEQANHVRSVIAIPGTDPEQLAKLQAGLEVWDTYKKFNDQRWQEALQKRQQDPNAGPIQRLENLKTKETFTAGNVAHTLEGLREKGKAAGQGLLSAFTLGLSKEMPESLAEGGAYSHQSMAPPGLIPPEQRLPVPKSDEAWHDRPLTNPWSSGLGSAVGTMLPGSAAGTLARAVFGATAPKLGRYGGAALSGAATTASEGGVGDVMAGETDDLGKRSLGRAALGAGASMLGQGVADLGRGGANKISERTIRGTEGRSPYEFSERMGWDYDPVRGIRVPEYYKQQQAITRETGVPWAERFADKARAGFVENVDKYHVAEKAAMGHENLNYFKSVAGAPPTPITNVSRAATEIASELEGVNPYLARQVMNTVRNFDPAMTPEQMSRAIKHLSGKVREAGKNEETAEAFRRLQAAMMEDLKALPKGNLEGLKVPGPKGDMLEGWPALRQQHDARGEAIEEVRQLSNIREEGASLPDKVAALNKNLMDQGRRGFTVAKEMVLDRFMPPALKQESMMIRAANMVDDISADNAGLYPSRAGVINWARGKIIPRAYGLGRAVSKPADGYPISDDMFKFLEARAPRATLFVPGMNVQKMLQERLGMEGRPKKFGDLTPDQQQLLLGLLNGNEQEPQPQEATP
ncbi:MAG TPA: hypothetical protein VFL17_08670 [Anaerolineae bacterium]|nr:hypothetical protein [Anaerolineae bacterium]